MSLDRNKALLQTIKKIPLFNNLSAGQVQALMRICGFKTFKQGEYICAADTPTEELYILLSGKLAVFEPGGAEVAVMLPVTTVGETSIATRQPRSVSVKAMQECHLLAMSRHKFESQLRQDGEMQATVYRNIAEALAEKIATGRVRLGDVVREKVKQEKRVKEHRRREAIAQWLYMEAAGLTADEAAARIDAEIVGATSMRVLVVDDEPNVRAFMASALSGYEVVQASDGPGALEAVRKQVPDLVITDIQMPDMDGFALLAKLRDEHPTLPVVAISGYVTDKDVQQYEFNSFVEKPVRLAELRETVRDALAREAS